MSRALKRPYEPEVKTDPDQVPNKVGKAEKVGADAIIEAIKEDTAKYDKERTRLIAAITRSRLILCIKVYFRLAKGS